MSGACIDRLSEQQQREITNLLANSSLKRAEVLIRHYGLCETCAMHVMLTTIFASFRIREGSTVDPGDAISAALLGISKVWDVTVLRASSMGELDEMVNTALKDRRTLH